MLRCILTLPIRKKSERKKSALDECTNLRKGLLTSSENKTNNTGENEDLDPNLIEKNFSPTETGKSDSETINRNPTEKASGYQSTYIEQSIYQGTMLASIPLVVELGEFRPYLLNGVLILIVIFIVVRPIRGPALP